jgi:hypothetical protein
MIHRIATGFAAAVIAIGGSTLSASAYHHGGGGGHHGFGGHHGGMGKSMYHPSHAYGRERHDGRHREGVCRLFPEKCGHWETRD